MNRLRAWWRKRRELAKLREEYQAARRTLIACVNAGLTGKSRDAMMKMCLEAAYAIQEREARP